MEKRESESFSRKKTAPFQPNRKFINIAVEEYLKRGGKITNYGVVNGYYDMVGIKSRFSEIDDF